MSKLNFLEIEEIPSELFYALKWESNTKSFKVFKTLYEEACGIEREYIYEASKEKVTDENLSDKKQIIIQPLNDLYRVWLPTIGYPEKCMIVFSNKGFISLASEDDFLKHYRYKK